MNKEQFVRYICQCAQFFNQAHFCKKIRADSRQIFSKNPGNTKVFLSLLSCALSHRSSGQITKIRAIFPISPDIRARPDLSGQLGHTDLSPIGSDQKKNMIHKIQDCTGTDH